jgi:Ca-activated chloride channel family protein
MMNAADFQHPDILALRPWLVALALGHALLFMQQWGWQRRQFSPAMAARFGPGLSWWRGLLKTALWGAAGWALLTALAVPLGPPIKMEAPESGADVVLAVDVSSSMLCMDQAPNRLQAVKNALQDLLSRLDGDRVGIIAFAGEAVVACPLTSDMDTAGMMLDKLDIDSVPHDGTGLAPALKLALEGLPTDAQRGRLIVLATDGEDNAHSDVLDQARACKAAGVPVFCVGVGSAEGALVPGRRDMFGRVFAKTWQGQPARSVPDKAGLKRIAEAAGGEYLDGGTPGGLARVVGRVSQLKQGLIKAPDRYVREPLYEEPLQLAVILLLIEALLSARSGGGLRAGRGLLAWWRGLLARRRAAQAAAGALLLLALAVPALRAAPLYDPARGAYNQGNEAYRQGDFQAAADAYRQAENLEGTQESAPYNLGNAEFKQQDYQGAVEAYQDALKLDPDDEDAKANLALAQSRLQDQQKQGKGKDPKDGKKGGTKDGQGHNGKGQQPGQQPGQGQGQGQGQGKPQAGQGKDGQGQAQRPRLNPDQVQAMMNQLKLDQKRYAGAFNPLKHYPRKDRDNQDPMQAMMDQMMGRPPQQPEQPLKDANGNDEKDW